jgi:hypothetical protein
VNGAIPPVPHYHTLTLIIFLCYIVYHRSFLCTAMTKWSTNNHQVCCWQTYWRGEELVHCFILIFAEKFPAQAVRNRPVFRKWWFSNSEIAERRTVLLPFVALAWCCTLTAEISAKHLKRRGCVFCLEVPCFSFVICLNTHRSNVVDFQIWVLCQAPLFLQGAAQKRAIIRTAAWKVRGMFAPG